ncbi:MAG: flotillin family protein [Clostridiales bacterium]|jgi:flotillin|nr:flotillin family protein [Clostridiales bacterium]
MNYIRLLGVTQGEIIGVLLGLFVIGMLIYCVFWLSRDKKCPPDKVMVIYGKVGAKDGKVVSSKCIHGGAAFIWPIVQNYAFLDLTPMPIEIELKGALTRDRIRADISARFTVAVSTEQGVVQNAAERVLFLKLSEIQELAKDIIFGQLRLVTAQTPIEEIDAERDKFLEEVCRNIETELKKIGLRLINANVAEVTDRDGYLDALNREYALRAVAEAKKRVAIENGELKIEN